ncbi:MAG: asparaginase [Deltaproteobacteria bacterium]|nr:asparaginase [Deltaproteobacteria bacterium]
MTHSLQIRTLREGHCEAEHAVSAVLVDHSGAVLDRVGPPMITTWRSGAKPFQLEVSLDALIARERAQLGPEDLAIGAASHSGEAPHTARVQRLLTELSLTSEALYCGAHAPVHTESAYALVRAGHAFSPLHNNCSGKHTLMAAATRAMGCPEDYRPSDHALQRRIAESIADHAHERLTARVTDGCGVPCMVLSIDAMARCFAALSHAMTTSPESTLGTIGLAMVAHPWWVSGTGRSDYALAQHAREPLIAKVGAEGLLCIAAPSRGLAMVLKVHSGHDDARMAAMDALASRWLGELIDPQAFEPFCTVRNVIGATVGTREARFV